MATIIVPTDAYAKVEDVSARLGGRKYDAQSKPNLSEVETIIKRVAVEINAVVKSLGLTTPLTPAADVSILSEINTVGAAYKVEAATLAQVGVANQSAIELYRIEFERMMKMLKDGEYTFVTGGLPAIEPMGNSDLEAEGQRSDPIFIMDFSEQEF